jgi:hypothetical protein
MQSTKSSIRVIPKAELYLSFDEIRDKLQISLDSQGDLASDTLETIYQGLMSDSYILATGDDLVMILSAEHLLTGKSVLSVINFWCKNPADKVQDMEEFLHNLAKTARCDIIVFTGRDAWGRIAKTFKADERIFVARTANV